MGRTLPIWNKFLKNDQFITGEPWLLRFFDQVRFYPVSEAELTALRDDFREGRAAIRIEETEFDFAEHSRFLMDQADDIAAFRQRQATAFETEVALWQQEDESTPQESVSAAPVENDESAFQVSADMNGNIWKVLVNVGDVIEAGQPLIIVEAMKMELTISAPQSGRVKRIGCPAGTTGQPRRCLAMAGVKDRQQ
nr:hypothetical protein PJ912_00545 [Pectobacterium colocasium]